MATVGDFFMNALRLKHTLLHEKSYIMDCYTTVTLEKLDGIDTIDNRPSTD